MWQHRLERVFEDVVREVEVFVAPLAPEVMFYLKTGAFLLMVLLFLVFVCWALVTAFSG